jgi:L-amino acid N-acyltransferase YncA
MIIREANSSDLEAISQIWNYYILHTTYNYDSEPKDMAFFEEWLKSRTELNYPIFVLVVDGGLVGYATYGQFRTRIGYRFSMEHGVYIAPGKQGKGYGKTLMLKIMEKAKLDGHHSLTAGIDASNFESIAFHQKFGFKEVGVFKEIGFKNGQWLDCHFLQLIL